MSACCQSGAQLRAISPVLHLEDAIVPRLPPAAKRDTAVLPSGRSLVRYRAQCLPMRITPCSETKEQEKYYISDFYVSLRPHQSACRSQIKARWPPGELPSIDGPYLSMMAGDQSPKLQCPTRGLGTHT
jgi:hypothetical protein